MKKNFFSYLFFAFSLCPSMAGNLLKVDHSGVHFEENLKQFSDKQIKKLVSLKRENEEEFKKKVKKYFDQESIQFGKAKEEQKNEVLEYLLWEFISKKVDYEIALPTDEEIFGSKKIFINGNKNSFLDKLKEENKEKIKALENCENIFIFIKSFKLNCNDIFFSLKNIVEKVFKFYRISDDFLDIAKIVFQNTFIQHMMIEKNEKGQLKEDFFDLSNVLDIMMYVRHKISQFDTRTKITLQHEEIIKEKLERKFAFYRKKKIEKKEKEILDFEEKVLNFNISKVTMVIGKKITNKLMEEINKNIDKKNVYGNIINPLKNIAKNVIFDLIGTFICEIIKEGKEINVEDIKTYCLEIIKYVVNKTRSLSTRYVSAFHEGAHAFVALHYNIPLDIAGCIDRGYAGGFVRVKPSFFENQNREEVLAHAESIIKICCAGILGGFSIDGILDKEGACSDFNRVLSECEFILKCTKCFQKDIPVLEKMKELSEKGMKMLLKIQELPKADDHFRLNSPLDQFLNSFITNQIEEKKPEEQRRIENMIAGCIAETFNFLKDPENNDQLQMLAEKIFDEGVIPQEKIERYGKDIEKEEFLEYIKNSNNQKPFSKKEAELMLHNDFRHFSIHKITIEEINQEIAQKTKEIEIFNEKNDNFLFTIPFMPFIK